MHTKANYSYLKNQLGPIEKLGRNLRAGFKARHGIRFKRQKRSITLTLAEVIDRVRSFHTFTQPFCGWQQVSIVGNFDEMPPVSIPDGWRTRWVENQPPVSTHGGFPPQKANMRAHPAVPTGITHSALMAHNLCKVCNTRLPYACCAISTALAIAHRGVVAGNAGALAPSKRLQGRPFQGFGVWQHPCIAFLGGARGGIRFCLLQVGSEGLLSPGQLESQATKGIWLNRPNLSVTGWGLRCRVRPCMGACGPSAKGCALHLG